MLHQRPEIHQMIRAIFSRCHPTVMDKAIATLIRNDSNLNYTQNQIGLLLTIQTQYHRSIGHSLQNHHHLLDFTKEGAFGAYKTHEILDGFIQEIKDKIPLHTARDRQSNKDFWRLFVHELVQSSLSIGEWKVPLECLDTIPIIEAVTNYLKYHRSGHEQEQVHVITDDEDFASDLLALVSISNFAIPRRGIEVKKEMMRALSEHVVVDKHYYPKDMKRDKVPLFVRFLAESGWFKQQLLSIKRRNEQNGNAINASSNTSYGFFVHQTARFKDQGDLFTKLYKDPHKIVMLWPPNGIVNFLPNENIIYKHSYHKYVSTPGGSYLCRNYFNLERIVNATELATSLGIVFLFADHGLVMQSIQEMLRMQSIKSYLRAQLKQMRIALIQVRVRIKRLLDTERNDWAFFTDDISGAKLVTEARKIVLEIMHFKDISNRKEKRQYYEFWRSFCEIIISLMRQKTAESGMMKEDHELSRIGTIEACLLWKAMDVFLDSSYSFHVVTGVGWDRDLFSRDSIHSVCNYLECPDVLDIVQWVK